MFSNYSLKVPPPNKYTNNIDYSKKQKWSVGKVLLNRKKEKINFYY